MKKNLNQFLTPLPSVSDNAHVQVVFRDVREKILDFAKDFDAIVGCTAYLTDQGFINSLCSSEKPISLITLDTPQHRNIRPPFSYYEKIIEYESYQDVCFIPALYEDEIEKTLGFGPLEYSPGWKFKFLYFFPAENGGSLMHNKFLVFLKKRVVDLGPSRIEGYDVIDIHPMDQVTIYLDTVAVWTGSFNLTHNANYSLENGVLIRSPKIAREYFREYFQIVQLLDKNEKKEQL